MWGLVYWLVGGAMAAPMNGIVGGTVVLDSEWPEVVALVDTAGPGLRSFCSGTLIAPEVVLTAAHCVDDLEGVQMAIAAGVRVEEAATDVVGVREVRIHPSWSGVVGVGEDAALVFLDREPLQPFLASLNSADVNRSWLDTAVDIVGYGVTTDEGEDGGTKRHAPTVVSAVSELGLAYFDGEHQVCFGDSGGPTFIEVAGGRVQVGVHSYVDGGCVDGVAWDNRVDTLLGWIEAQDVAIQTTPAGPPHFECSHAYGEGALGTVPFDLKCVASAPDPGAVLGVRWRWGDGAVSEGWSAEHRYTEAGTYHVTMCADFEGASGPWSWCVAGTQVVTACGIPDASFEAFAGGEPLEIATENTTDVSVYGCISDVQWQVFEGRDVSAEPVLTVGAWEPVFSLDQPGTYTVMLNVGGHGGTGAARSVVEVRGPTLACDSSGGSLMWFAWLPLLAVRRRAQGRG